MGIEPRNHISDADAVQTAEGNMQDGAFASRAAIRRGRRPHHVETLLVREPGDLAIGRSHRSASGRQKP